jgi:hypothetical protein
MPKAQGERNIPHSSKNVADRHYSQIKCDGLSPCQNCTKHDPSGCSYQWFSKIGRNEQWVNLDMKTMQSKIGSDVSDQLTTMECDCLLLSVNVLTGIINCTNCGEWNAQAWFFPDAHATHPLIFNFDPPKDHIIWCSWCCVIVGCILNWPVVGSSGEIRHQIDDIALTKKVVSKPTTERTFTGQLFAAESAQLRLDRENKDSLCE